MSRQTVEEVVGKYCQLRHHVQERVFDYQETADCFCRHRRSDLGEYFHDYGVVDQFIRAAVLEKIAEVQGRRRMGKRQRVATRRSP